MNTPDVLCGADMIAGSMITTDALKAMEDWDCKLITAEVQRLVDSALEMTEGITSEPSNDEPLFNMVKSFDSQGIYVDVYHDATFELEDGSTPYKVFVSIPLDLFIAAGDWDKFTENLSPFPMYSDFGKWTMSALNLYSQAANDGEQILVQFDIGNHSTPIYDEDKPVPNGFTVIGYSESSCIKGSQIGEDGIMVFLEPHGIYRQPCCPDGFFPNLPTAPQDYDFVSTEDQFEYDSSMDDLNNPIRAELLKILFQVFDLIN